MLVKIIVWSETFHSFSTFIGDQQFGSLIFKNCLPKTQKKRGASSRRTPVMKNIIFAILLSFLLDVIDNPLANLLCAVLGTAFNLDFRCADVLVQ